MTHGLLDTPLLTEGEGERERLRLELDAVWRVFQAELHSDLPCVNDLIRHVEQYRGKMLRPMLVLMAARCVAPEQGWTGRHRVVAAVVEMVHMATLVHDDILDEAVIRRRGATLNHLKGNEAAVMLGDYLISHAYHLCSGLEDQSIARRVAATTNTVCEGELLQLANRGNWRLDEPTYFEIIRRKTASLCGLCSRLGAEIAHATPDQAHALDRFGQALGMAFQIIDDVLDLTGQEQRVGKSLRSDLAKGKLTLPVIRYLQQADGPTRAAVCDLLEQVFEVAQRDGRVNEPMMQSLLQQFARPAVHAAAEAAAEAARDHAARLVEQAKRELSLLPDSAPRALMMSMADAVIAREW